MKQFAESADMKWTGNSVGIVMTLAFQIMTVVRIHVVAWTWKIMWFVIFVMAELDGIDVSIVIRRSGNE